MHQFTVWTALEAEGLGCNLQHYNYSPEFANAVAETWHLPATWKLKSQLNFGQPTGAPKERTYAPLEERVKVFE
jgi:predicted oxidoreductase (fatty acid repression mutant protein)